MMWRRRAPEAAAAAAVLALWWGTGSCTDGGTEAGLGGDVFAERCRRAAEAAAESRNRGVRGTDGNWFFPAGELRHLGAGLLSQRDWPSVAANVRDPVPYIERFRKQLRDRNIELLLVPVPPKAAIYPEKLFSGAARGDPASIGPLVRTLAERGIPVCDLEKQFQKLRKDRVGQLYCAQDSHWSPLGCEMAARLIHREMTERGWLPAGSNGGVVRGPRETIEIRGDLVDDVDLPAEILSVRRAGVKAAGGNIGRLPPDRDSPVLLLGDSHVLVFHEGSGRGMHGDRAGIADHLQHRLGFAIDVVGVRGSGMVAARRALLEHAGRGGAYWEKKKVVIWCFACSEFTQSADRLLDIPLARE